MKSARITSRAFTLIELMLVVAILGVAMALSYPAIREAMHRAPLTQGLMDVMEGCRQARRAAILQNTTMELRIYPDHIEVAPSPADADANAPAAKAVPAAADDEPKPAGGFSKSFADSVGISELNVNLVEATMTEVAARVRFYPNGTCDEMTMVLLSNGERRVIKLESVTALARAEMIQ